jgi:hypothetical protein
MTARMSEQTAGCISTSRVAVCFYSLDHSELYATSFLVLYRHQSMGQKNKCMWHMSDIESQSTLHLSREAAEPKKDDSIASHRLQLPHKVRVKTFYFRNQPTIFFYGPTITFCKRTRAQR